MQFTPNHLWQVFLLNTEVKKKKKKQEGDKTQNREVVKQREREHL